MMPEKVLSPPDFISIGAQKCATTWLYHRLRQHPSIFMGPKNVVRYFEDPHYSEKGWEDYLRHFAKAKQHQIIGDSRVEYVFNPETPSLIHKHLPKVKLILLLREPVERAVSAYLWHVRKDLLPDLPPNEGLSRAFSGPAGDLSPVVQEIDSRIVGMGFYAEQLERFLELFPMKQMLIFVHEDIKTDPLLCIQTAYRFLETDDSFVPTGLTSTPLKSANIDSLTQLERKTRWLYGSGKVWDWTNRLALAMGLGRQSTPNLTVEVREKLQETYKASNSNLYRILRDYCLDSETLSTHIRLESYNWLKNSSTSQR